MEKTVDEYNLNMYAEIISAETTYTLEHSRELLRNGLFFDLGDLDEILQLILAKTKKLA
jgi:hypothetical protein